MITRIWHGRTKKEDADIYKQYVIETGIKDYLKSEGILNVQIWQVDDEINTDIFTFTNWDNFEAIKKFASDDFEKAKYYPEDEKYLLELEEKVKHYNAFSFSNKQIKEYIRHIEEVSNGDNWVEESFKKKLDGIDKKIVFKQPFPGKHSVAEVFWHCIYWRRVILKRMEGDFEFEERTFDEQDFLSLDKLERKGWDNLLSEFKQSTELLINFLKPKLDDFLEEEYKSGYTNKYMIEGIIAHDFYHLGQIGLIISQIS